jgi:hypothetical protein
MSHMYDLQFRDWSDELSTVQVHITPITVVTIVAELVIIAALRTAIEGITIGVASRDKIIMDDTIISAARPASPLAQREVKWLVRYHGVDNNKKWTCEIPTADLSLAGVLVPGSDFADLTVSPMSDFVTAFQTAVRPPDSDTSLVVVDSVQFVGRNI